MRRRAVDPAYTKFLEGRVSWRDALYDQLETGFELKLCQVEAGADRAMILRDLRGYASLFAPRIKAAIVVEGGPMRTRCRALPSGRGIKLLCQARSARTIAFWTKVEEDPEGLRVKRGILDCVEAGGGG